jgi:gliding motility-associated-like protein
MPNTFTPNGDGQNDIFYPRGYGVKDLLVFRVFDRWGNLVHERTNAKANDANVGWLGFDKNGTKQLNPGVYVYYIEGTCSNDDKVSFSGNITLIR